MAVTTNIIIARNGNLSDHTQEYQAIRLSAWLHSATILKTNTTSRHFILHGECKNSKKGFTMDLHHKRRLVMDLNSEPRTGYRSDLPALINTPPITSNRTWIDHQLYLSSIRQRNLILRHRSFCCQSNVHWQSEALPEAEEGFQRSFPQIRFK